MIIDGIDLGGEQHPGPGLDVLRSTRRTSRPVFAPTGTHCPESGDWSPLSAPDESRLIFEGSLMPPWNNAPTLWSRHIIGAAPGADDRREGRPAPRPPVL